MNPEMDKFFKRLLGMRQLDSKSYEYLKRFALSHSEVCKLHSEFVRKFGDCDTLKFRADVRSRIGVVIEDGGFLLEQDEYERIKRIAALSGDETIFVIELLYSTIRCRLAFQFSLDLDYMEISSGSAVAEDVFDRPIRDFIVFGPSLSWFKLALNDEEAPVNIWHFSEENLTKGW